MRSLTRYPLLLGLLACLSIGARVDAAGLFGVIAGGGDQGLVNAVNSGDYSRASAALDSGASPNAVDEDGTPVLMLAASSGRGDLVDLLVKKGAQVNAKRRDGMTALIIAAGVGNVEGVRHLIDAGADLDAKNDLGDTAMSAAQQQGNAAVVRLIAQAQQVLAGPVAAPNAIDPAKWQQMMDEAAAKAAAKQAEADRAKVPAEVTSSVDAPRFHKPERPDDFAVVVGVEKYGGDLPEAQFAERDARAVRAHLVALGVPERNIKSLAGVQASKGKLEAYIEDWLPRNVKPDSRVFFYFSGHGAPDPKSNQAYLVPFDGDPNFLDKTGYPLKKLYANLNALKAKSVIVALDSCFSGAGGRSVLAEGARPLVTKVDIDSAAGGKLVLFAAASAKEITSTLKDEGHGIFTYYFLKGLDGEAKDESGAVTARGLFGYLKPKVQDAASRQNRDQTPVLEGASGEDLRLE